MSRAQNNIEQMHAAVATLTAPPNRLKKEGKGISPAATNAAAEHAAKEDARRGIALTLPREVVDAVAVIAEETGKGQRVVLADLSAEAAPYLMKCLQVVANRYDSQRAARIAKALGQTVEPEPEPARSFDTGNAR